MRKLFILFAALFAFVACTQNEVEELSANRADVPETLTVGFEGGDTRIELNEALKTVWTEGDEVSVFYQSYENTRWAFQGTTGDRSGELILVSGEVGAQTMDNSIIVYPYSDSYYLNTETCDIQAMLPAVQGYKAGSYGEGGNIMVAQSEFTQFSLKSVVGWLRVELTGEGQMVESITLRGNAGEQVAGELYIDTATAEATLASERGEAGEGAGGSLIFDDTMFTEVTLDCGSGVELGAEATAFYIALPPQTFAEGMTIEVNCAGYKPMTLSTESSITIERNHIVPMEAVEHEAGVILPSNELWYTATEKVEPSNTSGFNVSIVSNEWDEATGEGIITFNGELTTIGDEAFDGCGNLTSVTIPDSVTTIGDWAFYGCERLTSVTIPDSVTTIGKAAFASCSSLAEFKGKFAADGGRCLIKDNTLIAYAEALGATYTIPDSVTTIGEYAFSYCESLTSVTIPDSVTTIGYAAFNGCGSLTSVTIPDSVTTIEGSAFYYCSSLTSVTIGDSVTTIRDWAFFGCESLISITIPDSVTTIGGSAFEYCSSLSNVYCEATTPPTLSYYVFDSNASGRKIYVTAESVKAYKAAEKWSDYAADIVGYNFETGEVVAISNKLFYTATALVEPFNTSVFNVAIVSNEWDEATGEGVITFDGELTTIGNMAFYYCSSLTSVTIPDSVTTIGVSAFMYCESLTSVTIGDSVTTIGDRAFMYCYSLTSVTIPDSVTTIGGGAFASCYSLAEFKGNFAADGGRCLIIDGVLNAFALGCGVTEYTIPDSVTTIGDYAFYYCSSLISVTIPDSVTTIGDSAFSSCDSLAEFKGKFASEDGCCLIVDGVLKAFALGCGVTEYTIPDSVTTIGEVAFAMCDSLTSVTIDGSVTTIGNWAFGNCSSLTSVTIGDGVMTIGYGVFDSCSNLESVTIGNSVTTIGDFAFCYCESLTSITIPDSVMTIGEGAFERCRSLTSVTIGNSVTTIGNRAFFLCNSLTSITIPDSVTTIGMSVFVNCGSLTSVYCKAATPPTLGDSAVFDYNASGRKIYVHAESVEEYKSAENWSGYAADIVGYNFE